MKKFKVALIVICSLMAFSCRSYTIKEGRANISIPEESAKIETRFNVLEAERIAIENQIAAEKAEKEAAEAAKKAEEERIAAEERAKEAARVEAERKAEEERLEKERLAKEAEEAALKAAEEARIAEEKAAEEARIEKERLEQEAIKKAEEDKIAFEKALDEAVKEALAERDRIEAERKAEEERIAREAEEARIAEEKRIEDERIAAEEQRRNAINYYPENLEEIAFPHVYRPAKENLLKDDGITELKLMMIPLGEEKLSKANVQSIISSISDIEPDFIGLTGCIENQVLFASTYGKDAITFEDGTVIYRFEAIEQDADSAIFNISEKKTICVSVCDQEPNLPETREEAIALLSSIPEYGKPLVDEVAKTIECNEEKRVLFLSSATPATSDWNAFTAFEYRDDASFPVSDYLSSEGWIDAFDATRFNVETNSGITRKNGEIFERMDFIYLKSIMSTDSLVIPAAGLTDTIGAFITIVDVIIP